MMTEFTMEAFIPRKQVLFWTLGLMLAGGCAGQHELSTAQTPYRQPLASPGAQFGALPPDVQNTIRTQAGAAQIDNIIKSTNSGRVFYTIFFENRAVYPPLDVAADGSVLNLDLTVAVGAAQEKLQVLKGAGTSGLTLSDLPPEVLRSIQAQAPNAAVGSITKETHDGQVVYSVAFKNPAHPQLRIASNGTVLKDTRE